MFSFYAIGRNTGRKKGIGFQEGRRCGKLCVVL
jgi:hypothetical protein